VRGIPFHALHPQADFSIKGPTAFHFDLSYLSPLYKGEIKTPLYPLIYQRLKHLRAQRVETVAASFSYSQVSGEVALGSRFVGDVFAQIFKQPKMLDEKLPVAWKQRANALYLPELFNVEQARNILLQQAETNPDDASLHYALYQVSRESSSTRQASLGHLAEAIERDPVYALEYLALAPMAREKGHPDEALRVLQLAHEANPDNPFIALELAQTIIALGHGNIAVPVLQKLLNLNWSATIYPDMPKYLEQLLTEAGKE
jgi:tetratricopeptide (TPR) repeat protein